LLIELGVNYDRSNCERIVQWRTQDLRISECIAKQIYHWRRWP